MVFLKFCKSEFHSNTGAMYPCVLNSVAFSIRESLAPKCLFVCWLRGKEDIINEYSWACVWKTWLMNALEDTEISKKTRNFLR